MQTLLFKFVQNFIGETGRRPTVPAQPLCFSLPAYRAFHFDDMLPKEHAATNPSPPTITKPATSQRIFQNVGTKSFPIAQKNFYYIRRYKGGLPPKQGHLDEETRTHWTRRNEETRAHWTRRNEETRAHWTRKQGHTGRGETRKQGHLHEEKRGNKGTLDEETRAHRTRRNEETRAHWTRKQGADIRRNKGTLDEGRC